MTPRSRQRAITRSTGASSATRELAHDRLVVDRRDPVEREQPLAGVGGALEHQLGELDDPAPPQPAEVDDPGERVQRLRGADVRGRLLAADVLLAGLQREHEPALAVQVAGLAGDPAGTRRISASVAAKKPNDGPPKSSRLPSVWPSPDRDVDAALPGRAQQRQRQRVAAAQMHSAPDVVGGVGDLRLEVLDRAEEVRLGDDHRADVV